MHPSRRIRSVAEPLIDTFNRRARALVRAGEDLINLGQALPGTSPPAAAVAAAARALRRPATHIYSPDAGRPDLLERTARWIARHDGLRVDPASELIVTAGANHATLLALQCIADPGCDVLVPSPYFMNHEMAVRLVDARPVEVPTTAGTGYAITADHLLPYFTRRTRAVLICTPNNPTGAVVPRAELRRIANACALRDAFLIIDRTYAGFEFTTERPRGAEARGGGRLRRLPDNVVIIGSFSKVFAMTGWRVGYLAASAPLIREALKAQDTTMIAAPTIGQIAVAAALGSRRGVSPSFLAELRRRRDFVHRRLAEIPGWSAVPAAGGFFAFVRVDGCTDSIRFAHHLLDTARVLVLPGRIFGEAGEGHIRLSYGVADRGQLGKALGRIKKREK